jgi:glycosyltransferase involved in cell wall biosynthesis
LHHPPGGIGRYTAELAKLLPTVALRSSSATGQTRGSSLDGDTGLDAGIELCPFTARHDRATVEAALSDAGIGGLSPVILPLPRSILYEAWNVLGVATLASLSPRLRSVDLVHAPSLAVPPKGRAPLIVTVHDAAPNLFPETFTALGRWFHRRGFAAAARRADLVITPSAAAADEVAAHTPIPRARLRIVPHGVTHLAVDEDDVAAARAAYGLETAPYVLWVGTLEPRKNVATLVEAFELVHDRTDLPHRLVLVGPDGWGPVAKELRSASGATRDRVVLTGAVDAGRLAALYRGADLFALPSIHEGFGLPVLEAMSQHAAVLCSDIPALREVAGDAGCFVDARNSEAWADALTTLLEDDAQRQALADAGDARAAGFSWERCASETIAVYHEALGR